MSGKTSRRKGHDGEREVAKIIRDITGFSVKRRVRQDSSDGDLVGVPGWSIEVKRAKIGKVHEWWKQTVAQAKASGMQPVLIYKIDYGQWKAIWPLDVVTETGWGYELEWSAETSIWAWCSIAREHGSP